MGLLPYFDYCLWIGLEEYWVEAGLGFGCTAEVADIEWVQGVSTLGLESRADPRIRREVSSWVPCRRVS